jgi:lipopolysaccharide heptosyltransferase I
VAADRILLVKLSSLGDVVHALPVAAALRAARPGARLAWVVERREAAVLRGHPALDEVIEVDTRAWRRARGAAGALAAARALLALGRRLRAERFDVALDLQGLLKSGVLTAVSGAPTRIGFGRGWSREPLSGVFTTVKVAPPLAAVHVVDQYLALLAPLGIRTPRAVFDLPADDPAETRMDDVLASAGIKPRQRLVVVNPGAGRPDKRWPVSAFAELASRLLREAGAAVVVTWGPSERESAEAIVAGARAALLAPPTDLHELIALLRRASVVVAADTGPLHLAAALGVPCVGLYGPTTARRNGPYGAGHRALQSPDGRMATITARSVFEAVGALLGP